MSKNNRKVQVLCTQCNKVYRIELLQDKIKNLEINGMITVAIKPPCGHSCLVFMDTKMKPRGGQCADVELSSGDYRVIDDEKEKSASSEVLNLLLFATCEIIRKNIEDKKYVKYLKAEKAIEDAEFALILGNIDSAITIFRGLLDISKLHTDEAFHGNLKGRIEMLELIKAKNSTFDWKSIILRVDGPSSGELGARIEFILEALKDELDSTEFQYKRMKIDFLRNRLK